jgi:uncharacterized repeat protein (TIGR03803 family)
MLAKKQLLVLALILTASFVGSSRLASASDSIQTLHSFSGPPDGEFPTGTIIMDATGNLYGTTFSGGDKGYDGGTVFELSPADGGGWVETTLHRFTGGPDGRNPFAGLVMDRQGNLYGTAGDGGRQDCSSYGCGTVFRLAPSTGGTWKFSILHQFSGPDGATPYPGLVMDGSGNIFGATQAGGSSGVGVIYEMAVLPDGGFSFSLVHDFTNGADSGLPNVPTLGPAGTLYGTTLGSNDHPTAFELVPTGKEEWKFKLIYTFQGGLQSGPNGPMIFDDAGNLYGITFGGGSSGEGTAFELSPGSDGKWTKTLLYNFPGSAGGTNPIGPLVFDAADNLYGTTQYGNLYYGSVFELSPNSPSGWTATTLQIFSGANGDNAQGGVLRDAEGNLYGVTQYGGQHQDGIVYELTP